MDLAKYAVNAVTVEGRSIRQVAAATGRSKSWVQRHVALYREGGDQALVPRKRGPRASPNQTPDDVEDEIVAWRKRLDDEGADAGARTIHWHLYESGTIPVPSVTTIHRVLRRRGFVTYQPQKRPRSSWVRFESSLPNETWQSDMTHWQLDGGRHVEIINFIDDYSRAVLASVAVDVATSDKVISIFYDTAATYGLPQSVLSDNGAIYTASYRGASTGLEIDLAALGITFKHGKPYHPQTQGKVERYHRTLKQWLRKRPLASSIVALQVQIDEFIGYYNERRPHTARGCPPMRAWRDLDKAAPVLDGQPILATTKVRRDKVDKTGCFTLRHRSRLHHVGVGRAYAGRRVLVLMADLDVRVLDEHGEVIRHLTLDPSIDYQPRFRTTV